MALVTQTTLKSALRGGLVPENVLAKIWDISVIPLPFGDMIGEDSHFNEYCEWTKDKLQAVNNGNAVLDGSAAPADNNNLPTRVGNRSQISVKVVSASNRARDGRTLNMGDAYAYQVMKRQQELKRDIDAIALMNQASVQDNGSVAGKVGGFDAWLVTNTNNGATGANGGFQTGTGLVTAAAPGTARALSEATLRNVLQSVYDQGGNPSYLMARSIVIRKLSAYLFSATAQVASLMSDVKEKKAGAIATGAVSVLVTDFGIVLTLTPNRLQQTTAANVSSVFCIDPEKAAISYLARPNVFPLAVTGLFVSGEMYADWSLKVNNEEAHGVVRAIDETLAVTA